MAADTEEDVLSIYGSSEQYRKADEKVLTEILLKTFPEIKIAIDGDPINFTRKMI